MRLSNTTPDDNGTPWQPEPYNPTMPRSRILLLIKSLLALILIGAVAWHFTKLLRQPEVWERTTTIRYEYLALAGLLYLGAHTLWGTFFVQLMQSQGGTATWSEGIRAYFLSQFGKYVPGKAWVIVIRVMLLPNRGLTRAGIGLAATYETLTSMAAGALIGVCLIPWLGTLTVGEWRFETGGWLWACLAAIAGLPLVLGVLNGVIVKKLASKGGPDSPTRFSPPMTLLARGLLQDSLGWCLLGLSVWATVQGLSATEVPLDGTRFLAYLAAVAISYVAGFLLLVSPGGLGMRELVLQAALTLQLDPEGGVAAQAHAALIALALRLVWTTFEIVAALALGLGLRPSISPPGIPHGQ